MKRPAPSVWVDLCDYSGCDDPFPAGVVRFSSEGQAWHFCITHDFAIDAKGRYFNPAPAAEVRAAQRLKERAAA